MEKIQLESENCIRRDCDNLRHTPTSPFPGIWIYLVKVLNFHNPWNESSNQCYLDFKELGDQMTLWLHNKV